MLLAATRGTWRCAASLVVGGLAGGGGTVAGGRALSTSRPACDLRDFFDWDSRAGRGQEAYGEPYGVLSCRGWAGGRRGARALRCGDSRGGT